MSVAGTARALLVDLDGTLVDSLPDLMAALNRLLAAEGQASLNAAEVRPMVGDGAARLVERAFAARGGPGDVPLPALVERFLAIYEADPVAQTRPYPGAAETLEALAAAGWRLAICTNKPEAASRKVLQGLGLAGLFQEVAGGDSFPVRKPDAGHLLGALGCLDVLPRHAVMLGDSHNDLQAARNAGLPVILVSFGYTRTPARELGADAVIDHFDELPDALARLGFSA